MYCLRQGAKDVGHTNRQAHGGIESWHPHIAGAERPFRDSVIDTLDPRRIEKWIEAMSFSFDLGYERRRGGQ